MFRSRAAFEGDGGTPGLGHLGPSVSAGLGTGTRAGVGRACTRIRPELRLTRRYALPGSPYGIAFDRERRRLWVTLTATNRLVEMAAGARPHRQRTFASVRQPDSVAVEPVSGRVFVTGRSQGVLQLLDPPPLPRRR